MFPNNSVAFEKYLITNRIAYGAFSVVYEVKDIDKHTFCLKIENLGETLKCHLLKHEYTIQSRFNSPYICKSFEFLSDTTNTGISMELLGQSLANIRRLRANPPSKAMALNIVLNCLKGIKTLHDAGIIHSDIKPSNFLFRVGPQDYTVVLSDFGLSEYKGEDAQISMFRVGLVRNPRYLSLHTHETGIYDKNDDITCLLYTIADFYNDELPWDGRTTDKLVMEVKPKIDIHTILPDFLHYMIDQFDEDKLIQTTEQLLIENPRDIEKELHYILDPKDPDRKEKMVQYVMEEGAKKRFTNNHSA